MGRIGFVQYIKAADLAIGGSFLQRSFELAICGALRCPIRRPPSAIFPR